jgi:hypothetical protein
LIAVTAEISIALIVGEDNENVRLIGRHERGAVSADDDSNEEARAPW